MARWTKQEIDLLMAIYPDHPNEYCAEFLHRSKRACQLRANKLGITKTPEFAKQQREKNQFKKGHTPFNKGKKWVHYMSEEGQRNASKNFFGKAPHNKRPVGYEVLRAEHKGSRYWWIKPADGRRMVAKHRWLWEKANGPIPKGYNVQFKDGDTTNCVLENLYLISRKKQIRENASKQSEESRVETYRRITEKRNKSIMRDKLRIKWGLPQKTKIRFKHGT